MHMSRRILLPVALGALLLGGVPALADANGSTEVKEVERGCSEPADSHYSAPGPEDCRDGDGNVDPDGTYTAQYHSNDVTCGEDNSPTGANPTGIQVYASGDPAAAQGGIGVCSDGSGDAPAPVQGRAGLSGSQDDGYRIVVDGDKDNGNETAQGYLVAEGETGGAPTVSCGKAHAEGGKADSDHMEEHDNQGECG
jgi:hypothetical protein